MNFLKNPEYNGVKMMAAIVLVAVAGFFVFNFSHNPLGGKAQVIGGTASLPSILHLSGTDANPTAEFGTHAMLVRGDQGGSIELGGTDSIANGGTPYIDFHGNSSTAQDYNIRIINDANNQLSFETPGAAPALVVKGTATTVATLKIGNGIPIYSDSRTGGLTTASSYTPPKDPLGGLTIPAEPNTLIGYLVSK